MGCVISLFQIKCAPGLKFTLLARGSTCLRGVLLACAGFYPVHQSIGLCPLSSAGRARLIDTRGRTAREQGGIGNPKPPPLPSQSSPPFACSPNDTDQNAPSPVSPDDKESKKPPDYHPRPIRLPVRLSGVQFAQRCCRR